MPERCQEPGCPWGQGTRCTRPTCSTAEELALVPTEHEGPAGGAAAKASPAIPFTASEFDAILSTIYSDLQEDPFRIGDLLADALAFIAGIALHEDSEPRDAARAAVVLRAFEQRALWGPEHEQEDHQ